MSGQILTIVRICPLDEYKISYIYFIVKRRSSKAGDLKGRGSQRPGISKAGDFKGRGSQGPGILRAGDFKGRGF
ncbi:MAG: hypothetical protein U9N73_07010 [Candidatus Auribacterota bacterium]|nr:hypothetical protein [Candidatus Auribacterota bacterium]